MCACHQNKLLIILTYIQVFILFPHSKKSALKRINFILMLLKNEGKIIVYRLHSFYDEKNFEIYGIVYNQKMLLIVLTEGMGN